MSVATSANALNETVLDDVYTSHFGTSSTNIFDIKCEKPNVKYASGVFVYFIRKNTTIGFILLDSAFAHSIAFVRGME